MPWTLNKNGVTPSVPLTTAEQNNLNTFMNKVRENQHPSVAAQGLNYKKLQGTQDQYEIRSALESYTLRTVAGHLTPEQVARVRANLEAQARLRGTGDVARGVELDAEFHNQFAEFLGNGEILRVAGQLRERMQLVVTQVFRLCRDRIDTSYHEHTAIADAVIGGDGARASELIVRHLELGKQLILSPRG